MVAGWMEAAQGAVFSLAPADTAKIGLLTKCRVCLRLINLIMAFFPAGCFNTVGLQRSLISPCLFMADTNVVPSIRLQHKHVGLSEESRECFSDQL